MLQTDRPEHDKLPQMGAVRSRNPFKKIGAPIVSLKRAKLGDNVPQCPGSHMFNGWPVIYASELTDESPIPTYNLQSATDTILYSVYTIQPVVQPVAQPVVRYSKSKVSVDLYNAL